ncbi:MAG TPA: restriction endonuclease fold toxin-2 domain-containing protein, partial [Actinomycetota bacterium]|nr:restriction endonuclease fold toxin-2 domain-containing protein [Actinomycetota bacterium]
DNFLISGGGEQVWADGFRVGDAQVLDAKYVGVPERSPFIPGSAMPPAIRATIVGKLENEMARYSAVIGDASNPTKGLEVITNDPRAVPFFQDLLTKYGIPGRVVVQP